MPAKLKNKNGAGKAPERAYQVGYGKPPVEHQWKPGVSGNPPGAKKGSKSFKTVAIKAARKLFTVMKGGRRVKMTSDEIGMHNLQKRIAQGDLKAFLLFRELLKPFDTPEGGPSMQQLRAEDAAVLADFYKRTKKS